MHQPLVVQTTTNDQMETRLKNFRKAIAFPFRKLELCRHCRFRAGSFSGLSSRIQVFGTYALLRLPVLNKTHTNSYIQVLDYREESEGLTKVNSALIVLKPVV
jgi:hypothetical protein